MKTTLGDRPGRFFAKTQRKEVASSRWIRRHPARVIPYPARSGPRLADRSSRKMHFETVEPRILLSADLAPVTNPLDQQLALTLSPSDQSAYQTLDANQNSPVIDMAQADPVLLPYGSLIHMGPVSGSFDAANETDTYTVTVDQGQTLTIGILPKDSSIRSEISVTDPSNHTTTLDATTPGQAIALQNLSTGDGGTFTINFTNLEGTGSYEAAYWLNAQLETENYPGNAASTDNDTSTAVDLNGSSVALGTGRDRLAVVGIADGDDADYYAFTLEAGQGATLALAPTQSSARTIPLSLELLGPDGDRIALGEQGYSNVKQVIKGFFTQADGTYFAKVSGGVSEGTEYSLVITRQATFDLEPNNLDTQAEGIRTAVLGHLGTTEMSTPPISAEAESNNSIATANDLSGSFLSIGGNDHRAEVTGVIGTSAGKGGDRDYYKIYASPGDRLQIWENSESVGGVAGVDDTVLYLFDKNGTQLAYNDDYESNGNWLSTSYIDYTFGSTAYTGDYYIGADSWSSHYGGYRLITQLTTTGPVLEYDLADQYRIQVNAGDNLVISTSTPGDGAGEPVNNLDPLLELYNPAGTLVASNNNGAADGRNAVISYTAATSGAYRVRIAPVTGSGDYVLRVQGTTGPTTGVMTVTHASVSENGKLNAFPAGIDFTFSRPVRPDTVDTAAFELAAGNGNSVAVTGVTLIDPNTVRFSLEAPIPGDGVYTATLLTGSVFALDNATTTADPYVIHFSVDTVAPEVTGVAISGAPIYGNEKFYPGPLTFNVTFSKTLDPTVLDIGDAWVLENFSGAFIAPTSINYDTASGLTVAFPDLPEGSYTFTLKSADDGFRDLWGNLLGYDNDYHLDFCVDIDSAAYPTPLEGKAPAGSLIYDPETFGVLYDTTGQDVDIYTIDLDAGQRLSVGLFAGDAALQAQLEVIGPNGWLGTFEAGGPGAPVLATDLPVDVTGTYSLVLSNLETSPGSGAWTSGRFKLSILLNAAIEQEYIGGPANDDQASAQNIDGDLIDVSGDGALRAGVLGGLDAGSTTLRTLAGESFTNGLTNWTTWQSNSDSYLSVDSWGHNGSGDSSLYMEQGYNGEPSLNEAIWNVDLSGHNNASLSYWMNQYTFGQPFAGPYTGHSNADGVSVSADGNYWVPVYSQPDDTSESWNQYQVDLGAALSGSGLAVGDVRYIKFQQYSDGSEETWCYLDDVVVTTQVANALAPVSITANGTGGADYSGSLALLADGQVPAEWSSWDGAGNVHWAGRENTSDSPLYFQYDLGSMVRIQDLLLSGDNNDTYDVDWSADGVNWQRLVTVPAWAGNVYYGMDTFSTRAGDPQYDAGVDFTPVEARYMRISAESGDGYYAIGEMHVMGEDWYSFNLTGGEAATLALRRLSDSPQGNVGLELYDESGNRVSIGVPGMGNVDQLIADFIPDADGVYYARVLGSAPGDYTLTLTRNLEFGLETGGPQELLNGRVLGAVEGGSDQDAYLIHVADGDALTIYTATPGGDAGEPVNGLNPRIDLYDSSGNWIAGDNNSLGVNAWLETDPLPADLYRVVVSSQDGASGAYVLAVDGATGMGPAFTVTGVIPPEGAMLADFPSYITLDFSAPIDLRSVSPDNIWIETPSGQLHNGDGDVTVVDADTLIFGITTSTAEEGLYTLYVGTDPALVSLYDLSGQALSPFTSTFRWDITPPTVTSVNIGEGQIVPSGNLTVNIGFSEGMATAGVGDEDFSLVNETTGEQFTPQPVSGLIGSYYDLTYLGREIGSFADLPNLDNLTPTHVRVDPSVNFPFIDGEEGGYPDLQDYFAVRWTGAINITTAGDVTFYTESDDGSRLYIDGQLVVDNDYTHGPQEQSGTIDLSAGWHSLKLDMFENNGGATVILRYNPVDGDKQVIPADVLSTEAGGFYDPGSNSATLFYSGLTEGDYALTLVSSPTAFRDVGGNPLDGNYDGVAGGDFVRQFTVDTVTRAYPLPLAVLQPDGSLIYDPVATGIFHIEGDQDDFTLNLEAGQTLTVILSPDDGGLIGGLEVLGPSNATLATAQASEAGATCIIQTVPATSAGVYTIRATSVQGTGSYHLEALLNASVEEEMTGGTANDDQATAQNIDGSFIGIGPGSRGGARGELSSASDQDWYSFSLDAGQFSTITLSRDDMSQPGSIDLDLYDDAGHLLATGTDDAINVDRFITGFAPSQAGTFYVKVNGDASPYSLVVTLSETFGLELSGRVQDISDTHSVLGYVGSGDSSGARGALRVAVVSTDAGSYYDVGLQAIVNQLNDDTYVDFDASLVSRASVDTLEEISQYSAVVVGGALNTQTQFNPFASVLLSYVQGGGGLITTGWGLYASRGLTGQAATDFDTVVPVNTSYWSWNYTYNATITPTGTHPIVDGVGSFYVPQYDGNGYEYVEYPVAQGTAPAIDPGATVIATTGSTPVAAAEEIGSGRSVYLGPAYGYYYSYGSALRTGNADRLLEQAVAWAAQDSDTYTFSAEAGDHLVIQTTTPGDQPGEPQNAPDLTLTLYAPDGSKIAAGNYSETSPDGRNVRIDYTTAAAGMYRVMVSSEHATSGAYLLSVSGSTTSSPAFTVASTAPADGALLTGYPSTYTINLSESVLLSTIDASDLTVNGVAASGVTVVDSDTLVFYIANTAAGDGLYTVEIASGALSSFSGKLLQGFSATFDSDATAPRVTASSLTGGEILAPGDVTYTAHFSEPLATAGLGYDDVILTNTDTGTVIPFAANGLYGQYYANMSFWTDGGAYPPFDTLTPTYTRIDSQINMSDSDGMGGLGLFSTYAARWTGTIRIDNPGDVTFYTTSDEGSRLYIDGTLVVNNDGLHTSRERSGTVNLTAGWHDIRLEYFEDWGSANISLSYTPVGGTKQLIPASVLYASTAPGASSLTYDPATSALTANFRNLPEGNYSLSLTSDADGFRDVRGNLLDGEYSGTLPSGDGTAGGSFTVSFRVDATAPTPLAALQRVAPFGSFVYDPPATGNLYGDGDVDAYTITLDAGQKASVRVTPQNAALSLRAELIAPDGSTVLGSANGGAGETVILQNLAVADTGTYSVRISQLGGSGNYQIQMVLNASVEAEAYGGTADDMLAAAQNLDPSAMPLQAGADRLAILGAITAGNADWYGFTLAAGQSATLAVTRTDLPGARGIAVELYDASGVLLATGIAAAGNVDQSISGFTAAAAGTYYAKITGGSTLPYSLIVTRSADVGLETKAQKQDISLTGQVIGALDFTVTGVEPIRVAVLSGSTNTDSIVAQLNDDTYYNFTATAVSYDKINTLAKLANFDVVLLGDSATSHSQLASIAPVLRQWVEAGHGVVGAGDVIYISGASSGTPIADIDAIVPVDTTVSHQYQYYSVINITDTLHPVTTAVSNFGTYYPEYSTAVDPGATVLAYAGTQPAVVVSNVGAGRGIYLGPIYMVPESELRSGSADRLLEQAVAWAAGDRTDRYTFQATAGANLDIQTFTPGDGSGEPVNLLNARLELYDPNGYLVGNDDNGATDGRNARILMTAAQTGAYEVRVILPTGAGVSSRHGDYILQVNGATLSPGPAPYVVSSSVAEGAPFLTPPSQITLTFSEALLGTSVQASDLVLDDGGSATGVEFVDGQTLRFTVAPTNAVGIHHYSLAAGAVKDLQSTDNTAFSGSFNIDHTGPRVVSQTPAMQGSAPFTQIKVTFNEAISASSVSTADIQSFTGPGGTAISVSSVSVSGNVLTVNFSGQTVPGTYTMVLGPNISDLVNNMMDQNQDGANGQANDFYTATIDLQSPDLRADSLTNSTAANWGQNVTVSWTVSNTGSDPARESWNDAIYLSSDSTLDSGDRLVYAEAANAKPLAAGATYSRSATFALPLDSNPAAGNYYLLLKTDYSGTQAESNENNNVVLGQAIHIGVPAGPDAVVTSITAPTDLVLNPNSATPITVSWTVTNQGTAPMTDWHDDVWLSSDNAIGNDVLYGDFSFTGTLNPGESVTRTQTLSLPYNQAGDRWLVVQTDAADQHYEVTTGTPPSHPNAENNNTAIRTQAIHVTFPLLPDLQVTSITPPSTLYSGQDTTISWAVSNMGSGATSASVWYDFVYLSTDNVLDNADTYLGSAANPSYLDAGASYTNSIQATLPRGISGDYYLIVKTDYYDNVFESAHENNNVSAILAPVTLTPPPDLQVTAVSAAGGFSGLPMTMIWTVENRGEGTTREGGWYDRVYMSEDDTLSTSTDILLGTYWHSGNLDNYRTTDPPMLAEAYSYTRMEQVTLPTGMPADGVPTTYHFFVVTDATNTVYEHIYENNNANSDAAIVRLMPPPDLVSEPFIIPTTGEAGKPFSLTYQVTNRGATEIPGGYWVDRFWLSIDDTLDSGDIYMGERGVSVILNPGDSYINKMTYTLPYGLTGTYRVFMKIDATNAVFEGSPTSTGETNNTLMSGNTTTVFSHPADLQVDAFTTDSEGTAGQQIAVSWTVKNHGTGDTVVSDWYDQIIGSVNGTLGDGDDFVLATVYHPGQLNALGSSGDSYTVSTLLTLPISMSGDYNLFLATDVKNQVYESDNGNNAAGPNPLTVYRNTADLQVTSISAATADVTVGGTLNVGWRVENRGVNVTNSNYWYDEVYLSTNSLLDGSDRLLGSVRNSNALYPDDAYDIVGAAFTIPFDLTPGDYTLIVKTDGKNQVLEDPSEDNNTMASAATIHVNAWTPESGVVKPVSELRPDLVVTAVDAPSEGISGQGFSLTWTVQNQSATDNTGNQPWYDTVYLSRDLYFDSGDIYVGFKYHEGDLAANDSYTETATITIPAAQTGPFYVFVVADAGKWVTESNETNNVDKDTGVMDVSLAPPANLVAGTITVPVNGVPGQGATITYHITNETGNIIGSWKDTLYLSKDQTWDINDAVFGSVWNSYNASAPLAAGGSYSHEVTAVLPGVDPGNYYLIVRSDILNYVPETSEADNLSASVDAMSLDAEQLPLNGSVTGYLANGQAVYYRLVADAGQTIRITMVSEGAAIANELYVRYASMPGIGKFDYSSLEGYTSDPQVLIPETQAGTYYIMAYGASVSGLPAYLISASVIPFSITQIDGNEVGNTGESTLEIQGAKFAEATAFFLRAPDDTLYAARNVSLEDASKVYATFDLYNAAPGLYDVIAVQADGVTTAILEDQLTVSEGTGADVWASIDGPTQVSNARLNPFTLQYTNSGGADTLAPLLIATSDAKTPLGFSADDLRTVPVQILGASLDGPMDILRPGARYSLQFLFQTKIISGPLSIQVSTIMPDDSRVITDDEWAAIQAAVRPAGMADADWNAWWASFQPAIGSTWGSYVQVIDRMMMNLSEQDHPIRDVRALFAKQIAQHPDWLPFIAVSGTLKNALTDAAMADTEISLYRLDRYGHMVLGGSATTDSDGKFMVGGLQDGLYDIYLTNKQFDMDCDGTPDTYTPNLTVFGNGNITDVSLYALEPTEVTTGVSDTEPQILVDGEGVSHAIWTRNGQIFHAWYNGTEWVDAQAVYSGTPNCVAAAAGARLIDGSTNGLIVVWTEGEGNDSEVWYVVGRKATGGGYEWSTPIRLTDDSVADRGPAVAIDSNGDAVITYTKCNEEIQDDTDVYYSVVDVSSGALVFTATQDGTVMEMGAAAAPIEIAGQTYEIPFWKKELNTGNIFGFEAKASIQVGGIIKQSGCTASASLNGKGILQLQIPDTGEVTGELGGSLSANWKVDYTKYPNCDWKFDRATLDAKGEVGFKWQNGLTKVLGFYPPLWPAAKVLQTCENWINRSAVVQIEDGVLIGPLGFEAKGLYWEDQSPIPTWNEPISAEALNVYFKLGLYASLQEKGVKDTYFSASGSIGGRWNIIKKPSEPTLQFIYEVKFQAYIDGWNLYKITFNGACPESAGFDVAALSDPTDISLTYDPEAVIGTGNVYGDNALLAGIGASDTGIGGDLLRDTPMVMADDSGTVFGVWAKDTDPYDDDIGSNLWTAEYDSTAGTWTSSMISGTLGFNNSAAVAVDGSGNRILVWSKGDTSGLTKDSTLDDVQARRDGADLYYSVDSGSDWSAPALLATTAGMDRNVSLARGADGNVVAAWTYHDGTSDTEVLISSVWSVGAGWATPVQVATGLISAPTVGVVDGNTTIFWNLDTDPDPDLSEYVIKYSTLTNGAWSDAQIFAPQVLAASVSDQSLTTTQSDGSDAPISTSGLFPPFSVPKECCQCSPDKIKKITESAPSCDTDGGGKTTFDYKNCIEKKIKYAPCVIRPRDPNDIQGPAGFGDENYIPADDTLSYTIRFENAHDASAPAQQVVVTQTLDPDLDPRTFRVDDFGWGDYRVSLDANKAFYSGRLDFTATRGYYVDVSATVDVEKGEITWILTTIDPATGEQPIDASIGFLPVNDTIYDPNDHSIVLEEGTHRGEGFVSYTIRPKSGSATGSRIDAEATIVFDTQPPIATPAIFNTLDAVAPSSAVKAFSPDTTDETEFPVSWSGTDDNGGSAIEDYTIYVSQDGAPFSIWLLYTTSTDSLFRGEQGHHYSFYSTARDNAGNEEAAPTEADASMTVGGANGSISGTVFEDMNDNGAINASDDLGLADWTVYLDANDNGALDEGETSTTTASDGTYRFDNLAPGEYTVREVLQSGWMLTTLPGRTANVAADAPVTDVNFGDFELGQVTGVVFHDLNALGTKDAGEPVLEGWTVSLDLNKDGDYTDAGEQVTTGVDGAYSFNNVGPGQADILLESRSGWVRTTPEKTPEAVRSGQTKTFDVGAVKLLTISGVKFNDQDGDGVRDTDGNGSYTEPGLQNWTILLSGNGVNLTEHTDAEGRYSFDNLMPGEYTIAEEARDGWVQTSPLDSVQIGYTGITTSGSTLYMQSFGFG